MCNYLLLLKLFCIYFNPEIEIILIVTVYSTFVNGDLELKETAHLSLVYFTN